MKSRSNDEAMAEMYQDDPEYALEMINSVLEDGDAGEFAIVMRQLVKAFGVKPSSDQALLTPAQHFQALSGRTSRFASPQEALEVLGLKPASDRENTAKILGHVATA